MDSIWALVWGVGVPALIATAFAAIGWQLWRFGAKDRPVALWAAPVGMGLGVAVGIVGLMSAMGGAGFVQSIPLPPRQSFHWLPWIGLASIVLAVAGLVPARIGPWVYGVLGLALASFAAIVIVYLRQRARLGDGPAMALTAALVVGTAVVVASNELAARRLPGWAIPLHLTIVGTALAVALGATGTLRIGQYAGVPCAVTGPWIVAGLLRRDFRLATGGIAVFAVLAMSLAVSGVLYSSLPAAAALLLAVAAAAPGVALVPMPTAREAWLRPTVAAVATMALVVAAMVAVVSSGAVTASQGG